MATSDKKHDGVINSSYQAMALVDVSMKTLWVMIERNDAATADSVARTLQAAMDRMAEVHNHLEAG